ncbi:MAG: type 4a pilus biogenesis protein PilO [Candidatus Daviesbacteria bacterium]
MQPKEFYIKYKFIIWPALVAVSEIILLVFVIIPQLMSYLNVRNQISEVRNRAHSLNVKASELQEFDAEGAEKDLQVVFTILPADQDVPQAMAFLQALIANNGLQLKNTAFVGGGQSKNSYQLRVVIDGQINALRNFLLQLQEAPRIYQIESLSVQFQRSEGAIEAEMPLSVFYEPAPSKIGSLDQPIPKLGDEELKLLAKLYSIAPPADVLPVDESTASALPLGKSDPFQ